MVYVGKHSSPIDPMGAFPVQCFFLFGPVPCFLEYILCDMFLSMVSS